MGLHRACIGLALGPRIEDKVATQRVWTRGGYLLTLDLALVSGGGSAIASTPDQQLPWRHARQSWEKQWVCLSVWLMIGFVHDNGLVHETRYWQSMSHGLW